MILVSSCLAGNPCKYSGGDNLVPEIQKLVDTGQAIAVCPEQLGGLPTPRPCSEIQKGRVINTEGKDVTAEFEAGAEKAMRICMENHCTLAVLKSFSPSCGCSGIYDGHFCHKVIEGKGIFAQKLEAAGIRCLDEKQYMEEKI